MKNLIYVPAVIFFIAAILNIITANETDYIKALDIFLITIQCGVVSLIILYFSTQIIKTSRKKKFVFLILWFLYLFIRIFGFSQVTNEYDILGIIMLLGWGFAYIAPWIVLGDKYEQKIMSYTLIISLIGLVGVIYIQAGEVFLTTFINFLLVFPLGYFTIFHITKSFKK